MKLRIGKQREMKYLRDDDLSSTRRVRLNLKARQPGSQAHIVRTVPYNFKFSRDTTVLIGDWICFTRCRLQVCYLTFVEVDARRLTVFEQPKLAFLPESQCGGPKRLGRSVQGWGERPSRFIGMAEVTFKTEPVS